MRRIHKPPHSKRRHIACIAIVAIFSLSCLALSCFTPQLDFDLGVIANPSSTTMATTGQATSGSGGTGQNLGVNIPDSAGAPHAPGAATSSVVVKRVPSNATGLVAGDIIESVDGTPVHTRADVYHKLLSSNGDEVELTVRRLGARYQRITTASDFAGTSLPPGVRSGDKPELIADENGNYTPINGSDIESLRSLLADRRDGARVVFRRPEEIIDVSVGLSDPIARTLKIALALLFLPVMGVIAWRSRRARRTSAAFWTNVTMGLGCASILTLAMWSQMMSIAPLFIVGLVALTLFKVVDFDYHLTYFGKHRKTETLARIAIYAGPLATLLIPLWYGIGLMPVIWGGNAMPNAEVRLDSIVVLPMFWAALYTILDAAMLIYRRYKREESTLAPHEIGVFIAAISMAFVFALSFIDMPTAQMFLMAAILAQCLGNGIGVVMRSPSDTDVQLDSPIFSTSRLRSVLEETKEIFDDSWLVQVVIDRPTPRHIVALTTTDAETGFGGIDLNILNDSWRDFLEVFRIEGCVITGDPQDRDSRNPAQGIADKLGIVIALPIADNVAGTLSSLTFLVSSKQIPDHGEAPSILLSPAKRQRLSEIIDEIRECAAAIVYQSAEISLEFVGEDIDEFTRRYHETASFARVIKNPTAQLCTTAQLDPRAIPHGLIDEEEMLEDEEVHDPKPETPSSAPINISCETRQYEDEIAFLRSQVAALHSQQLRGYALSEIELTKAQREASSEMASIDPPILLVGEPGTGKRTLALAAHQARSQGAFLTIDAAVVSESIFALDMFGDGQDPGLIASAAGGGLLIQNAERVSEGLLGEVFEMIEQLPAKDNLSLYLTINVSPDDFSVEQYKLDPSILPDKIQKIANRADAEVVVLDPLRTQDDLDTVAEFFCQKQAFAVGKNVDSFSAEAMLALKSYAWLGNFGELRSVVERAVLRCEGSMITVNDLGRDFVEIADASTKNIALSGTDVFREQVQLMQILNETLQGQVQQLNSRIKQLEEQVENQGAPEVDEDEEAFLSGTFADIEKRLIDKLLDKYDRDPDKTAEALDLNRSRFIAKLNKYNLIAR